ncbi:hypothetical protein, partial [Bathymodiolus thermophilus thioautotrophic gill symbiont]|uniref:WD40 repeat domain-containing protein n=1 Tax=Bathymodiolus thermophilus thioautotrophic gill symbiont TaxID=2360 RepID=UPI0030B7F774
MDNCQFEFEHTAFSKALQWHIYVNSHKLKTSNVQNLSQFDFLQTGHAGAIQSANFSPDGQTIISASWDNTFKLWNLNGQCLHTFTGHPGIQSANFSPDGQTIISTSHDNTLKLWNLNG